LELARNAEDGPAEAASLEGIGRVLRMRGLYREALATLDSAGLLYAREGDAAGEARAAAVSGRIYHREGNAQEGLDRIEQVLRRLSRAIPAILLAELVAITAHLHWLLGHNEESLRFAEEASRLARALGEDPQAELVLADAEMRRGVLYWEMGHADESRRILETARPIAERAGDLVVLGVMAQGLARDYESLGDPERTLALKHEAVAIAERMGNPGEIALYLSFTCPTLVRMGRQSEARQNLHRAEALARLIDPNWLTATVAAGAGWFHIEMGEWTEAVQSFEAAARDAQGATLHGTVLWALAGLAWIDILHGRPEPARDRMEPLLQSSGTGRTHTAWMLLILGMAHSAMGDDTLAASMTAQAVELADTRAPSDGYMRIQARRARAIVLLGVRRFADALDSTDDALSIARTMRLTWEEALMLETRGDVLARAGNNEGARASFQAALRIFTLLQAGCHVDRVERALASTESGQP
ncbi:MAG TPA: hypothetical protein VFB34_08695, partial [Chloroflexota bacterium]|nr:hypothetical protein [Chloroflexota bacterium]